MAGAASGKTHRHKVPIAHRPTVQSPDGVSDAQASQSPSALSFLLFGSSLPITQTGRDCLATHDRPPSLSTCRRSCSNLRPKHRWRFRTSSNQATLPHYGFSRIVCATCTLMTRQGTGLPNPEAAVVPALVSALNSEVTSLERVTARSAWVCTAFRPAILSSSKRDFPLRKQKLGVSFSRGVSQFSTVSSKSYWQALPYLFGWAFRS